MKRLGNLYHLICNLDNLRLADANARKGKTGQYGIFIHDKTREENLLLLQSMLINKTYRTSKYSVFEIREPKVREIYRLPYFPDRITHHAVMNVLKPVFLSLFTADTYSCIEGRGIHSALNAVRRSLYDVPGTRYCLKIDIKKYYPNIDHSVLKALLRRKFKDHNLLWLLDEIIDSADGLPIGNYLSQYFANFYLTPFDHWIKETMNVRHYFRYLDDMVILSSSKEDLHNLLSQIRIYLKDNLKLELKDNYQVFPVESRGIDLVGYVIYHGYTKLRKSIKKNFARMVARNYSDASAASYNGWASHCNSGNLIKKLLHERVQRPGNLRAGNRYDRGQDQHRSNTEQTDCSPQLQS